MRFPESLIQLKASEALKGAFSLPWFYLLFPLTECRRELIPEPQQQKKQSSISGTRRLPGRSSAFCWFHISFFRHMNTGSKHKSVQVDQKDDCLVMHLNCQDRSSFSSPRKWIGATGKDQARLQYKFSPPAPGVFKISQFHINIEIV